MKIVRQVRIAALAFGFIWLAAGTADAARYATRCVATPACKITCTSSRAVACHARILPNGRCYRRCFRAR